MEITAEMVKNLRQQSGAGIMECKNALKETCGNIEEAVTFLRKKGLAKAEKKADRETGDGMVCSYIHPGSKIGVMAQVLCETDFDCRSLLQLVSMNCLLIHLTLADAPLISCLFPQF